VTWQQRRKPPDILRRCERADAPATPGNPFAERHHRRFVTGRRRPAV